MSPPRIELWGVTLLRYDSEGKVLTHAMKAYGWVELHSFLTSTLDVDGWSASLHGGRARGKPLNRRLGGIRNVVPQTANLTP